MALGLLVLLIKMDKREELKLLALTVMSIYGILTPHLFPLMVIITLPLQVLI